MLDNYTKIVLKSGKDQALKRFHPWVFSGAIKKMYGSVAEGDLVTVYSNKDEFLGIGHLNLEIRQLPLYRILQFFGILLEDLIFR